MQHFQEKNDEFLPGGTQHILLAVVCFPVVLIALFFRFSFRCASTTAVDFFFAFYLNGKLIEIEVQLVGKMERNRTDVFTLFRAGGLAVW